MNKSHQKLKHIQESNKILETRIISEKTVVQNPLYDDPKIDSKSVNYYNPKNLKFGDRGEEVKILQQKLMDDRLLKTKSMIPTGYFGHLTKIALDKISGTSKDKSLPSKEQNKPIETKENDGCPIITPESKNIVDLNKIVEKFKKLFPSSNPYEKINSGLNYFSKKFSSQGIRPRIACEIALVTIRPGYDDKNIIVVDSKEQLIYFFDRDKKFIAKDVIITGKHTQSQDAKLIAKSLLSWEDQCKKLGFKWDETKKTYVDVTGKNRKYDDELVYSDTDKNNLRFLPKGIYQTASEFKDKGEYAGVSNNVLSLMKDGNVLSQAIHGYYIEQPRTEALMMAKKVLSNPNDPKVSDEFVKLVAGNKVNLKQSYGCINLTQRMLEYLRKYGANSYVFNIGETGGDYLVYNGENYLNKVVNSKSCPSPEAAGAEVLRPLVA